MKELFLGELNKVERKGIKQVATFLEDGDFFTAPASTQYHNVFCGGLAEHSLGVLNTIRKLNALIKEEERFKDDSLVLVALLHDVCKAQCYKVNRLKNGSLSDAKPYVSEDVFPVGHGEKSVIQLLRLGLDLTEEEMIAIRYHMLCFDDTGMRNQKSWNKLTKLLFLADFYTTNFIDKEFKKEAE